MPWLRKALYTVTLFTVSAMVVTCMLDTFWCGRYVSVNWSLDEDACSTFNSKVVFRVDWMVNIATDLLSESLSVVRTERPETDESKSLRFAFSAASSIAAQPKANLGSRCNLLTRRPYRGC